MKQVPSRLEYYPGGSLNLLTDKINELRDYLSDKAIVSSGEDIQAKVAAGVKTLQHKYKGLRGKCVCGREKDSCYHIQEEASKGEKAKCEGCSGWGCEKCNNTGYPPQQEECPKCGKKMVGMYCCDLSSQEALDILKDVKPEESMGECLTCGKPVRSGSTKEVCVCPERKPDGSWKPQLKEESPKEDEQEWTHDFYELMQTYRHTLITDQVGTSKAYELVKDYIKANFVSKGKILKSIEECVTYSNPTAVDKVNLIYELGLMEGLEEL